MKLTPMASTRIRTSPEPGAGTSTASMRRTSGPPAVETRTAFMCPPAPERVRHRGFVIPQRQVGSPEPDGSATRGARDAYRGGIRPFPPDFPLERVPMRTSVLVTALALITASSAQAHGHLTSPTINSSCCDAPARWADRQDPRDARLAITTESDDAMLVLTDEVVAVQLSDRVMRKVRREFRRQEDEDDDNALAHAIKTAVLSGVRALLDHS